MSPDKAAAVRRAVSAIPSGCVCAYGRIAELAGLPGRARLVGQVLAESPPGDRLPWHRVVRADGRIAFPAGTAARTRQERRLAAEGVALNEGRVDIGRYGWQTSLDEMLWGPS